MQEIIKLAGFVIISLFVLIIIRQAKAEMQIPVKLVVSIVMLSVFVLMLKSVLDGISGLVSTESISKYASIILKALFVSVITSICTSLCADAGESTLGYICTLIGKAEILILAIPLILEIAETAIKLIDGANI